MNTATAATITDTDYFARYDRIAALLDTARIEDEEHDSLIELLDRADAFDELSNLNIVDGLLATYEAR